MRRLCRSWFWVMTVVAVSGVAALGCTKGSTTASAPATTTASSLSSFATLPDLQRQLESKGIPCKLEYEGLDQGDKTLSICVIDGSQATLTIWHQPEVLQKFLAADLGAKGATAVGANWTVDVDTEPIAQKVATALGGTVKASTSPTSAR